MQHLEDSVTPVLYIGRTVLKGKTQFHVVTTTGLSTTKGLRKFLKYAYITKRVYYVIAVLRYLQGIHGVGVRRGLVA
jgi:hypothetical protein